ncbi:hypothetical protein HHK36_009842 [Tetracentron sinense]|uniref:Glycosyltransferase n=1 Tax=Tetracentron sinense TaxID=13715 RepID=A0A834ZMA9_TETSI|nr:hypothetical protein HHK36_009842 [Tetracentron sinense]
MPSESLIHVFMVSFPGQGHVKPLLRLAKRLASTGLLVTFSSNESTVHMMRSATDTTDTITTIGEGQLRFEPFSDGWDLEDPKRNDLDALMNQLETAGKESLTHLINRQSDEGRPVSCLINNPFVPWASDVAADLGIPCAVLWVQSCALYSSYYHYLHGLASFPTITQPELSVNLPGLPTLLYDEVPSFLHPSSPYISLREAILGQFKNLSKSFCVLVDSFEELEHEIIEPMSHLSPIKTVGPLFKFSGRDNTGIRGDMWTVAEDCLDWLDSQPPGSVVYVSVGSLVVLKKEQMDEIAWGLLNTGLKFLWVVKPPPKDSIFEDPGLPDGFITEAEGKGMVVQWCPQEKVLAHPSIACFVTHCGWNSSLESLSSGVPMVAFPQWGDQVTNAKLLADVYGVGVRLGRGESAGELVSREEVERCVVEATRGPKAEEMKKNSLKWKKAAEEAVVEGGSSDRNIQSFVDDIRRMKLL